MTVEPEPRAPVDALYPGGGGPWWCSASACSSCSSATPASTWPSRRCRASSHATTSQLQWVVAIYSLVFAGLLFSTGAIGDRFGRKGALQFGLVLFLVGCSLAARCRTSMWQLIGCRALMGVARRVHHAVDAVDHRQRLPARRAHQGHRHLGQRDRRRRRHRPGGQRLAARPLLVRLGVPRQRADHHRGPRLGLVPRAQVAATPSRPSSTRSGAVLSIVGIVALVYGLIQAPDAGWASAGHPRRLRRGRRGAHRCSPCGSCTPTSPCSTSASSRTRRSASAPAA